MDHDFEDDDRDRLAAAAQRKQFAAIVALLAGGSLVVLGMATAGTAVISVLLGAGLVFGAGRILIRRPQT
jgi:hypothetical protein